MKILLAVDDSACTHHLFGRLAAHPSWLGASHAYTALHVLEPLPNGLAALLDAKQIDARQAEAGRQVLASLGNLLDRLPGKPERAWAIGDPATVLAERAAREHFDLVMVGSHGHGALGQLLLGSTVARLLARSTVPVLAMR